MTNLLPDVPDTARYTVGETAEILGIDRRSVHKYTKQGLMKFGLRRINNRKFYTGFEIKRFWKAQE